MAVAAIMVSKRAMLCLARISPARMQIFLLVGYLVMGESSCLSWAIFFLDFPMNLPEYSSAIVMSEI